MEQNKEILRKLGVSYLKPYQELIISHILECDENKRKGKILGCLPTGSGKSLCFMYPIAAIRKRTILIYPLLSLMNDQARRFQNAGIPFVMLQGGLEQEEKQKRLRKLLTDTEAAVVTNVETLLAMQNNGTIRLFRNKTAMIVIDEAHTAVTWGESFREAYLSLPEIIESINPEIIVAFTATMNKEIEDGIRKYIFGSEIPYTVHESTDRENIYYHSFPSLSKRADIINILSDKAARPAVIFCRSRELTEEAAESLKGIFPIQYYHAGLPKAEKLEKEKWFADSEDGVLAATSAYGMGVDKKNIRTVIHYSMPSSPSDYLQESGRGGRDGRRMDSYVLWYPEENTPLSPIFKGTECIRMSLLKAMNENPEYERCLACNHCRKEETMRAGEKEILRFILFHPGIGIKNAAASITAKHLFFRSSRLRGWTHEEAEHAIRIMISDGMIRKIGNHLFVNMKHMSKTQRNKAEKRR